MEDNENYVTEEVTENVETQPTEEVVEESVVEDVPTEKTYTQAEVDELIGKRLARAERKWQKETNEKNQKYYEAEDVLKQGLGVESIEDATNNLKDFYRQKGMTINEYHPVESEEDIEILARAEADELIESGFDEVKEEVDRLAQIGVENMTPRQKKTFQRLATYRRDEEQKQELRSLGINDTESEEFLNYSKKLNPELSLKEKYEMYEQIKPKKEIKTMESLKSGANSEIKEYYSPEEISRLTDEELDNPKIWEAVRRSMTKTS